MKYKLAATTAITFFLAYSLFFAFGSKEGAPQSRTGNGFFPYLTDKPLTEDGYYMLTVAWNISEGKGFTYNYGIKTTGVQPLAAVVYAIPAYIVRYFGGNKYSFVKSIIIFSALLQLVFAFLIYLLAVGISEEADKGLYFLVSLCVVLLNFKVLLNFANGLETGLYLVLLSIFFLFLIRVKDKQLQIKHLLLLGLLSGMLLLCRLDSAIILMIFYLMMMIKHKIKVTQVVIVLFIASLLYLPWEIYVLNTTGHLLQSSVRSQVTIWDFPDQLYRAEQYFTSIIQHLTPFLYTGNIRLWLMFVFGIPYIIFLSFYFKKNHLRLFPSGSERLLKLFVISFTILLVIYFFFSAAPYFYFRYTAFVMVFSLPVIVVMFADLFGKMKMHFAVLLLLIPLVTFLIQAYFYLHSGKSAVGFSVRPEFIKMNFDPDTRVAAFQTGVLGYFCDNVFNLDGKIDNSALESFKDKGIEYYIDKRNIDVLMGWKDFVPYLFRKEYLESKWQVYSEDIGDGRTVCFVRRVR